MLTLVEKILFVLLAGISIYWARRFFLQAFLAIGRGGGKLHLSPLPGRLWRAIEVTITQRTVFRARRGTSLMHGFVVWGFLFFVLVNTGDVIEGYFDVVFLGTGAPGKLYRLIADILSVAILIGMTYFLLRRFVAKAPSLGFHANILLREGVESGVRRDSLVVGVFILTHVGARFAGQAFRIARDGRDTWQPLANATSGLWTSLSPAALEIGEHAMWWLALGTILAFIPYFPYSKHMHLFMGPLNYLSRPQRKSIGALDPLDFEDDTREQFGAAHLEHLSKTQLFDAFACIMCNRCQDVCPAYLTGKELSPSALEINKRYEIRAHFRDFAKGAASPRPLLDFAISSSGVWACTTCGACIEICPVGNEPMFDILDIRRDLVLTQGAFPSELHGAFRGMEGTGNPWQMRESRMKWAEGLEVPTVDELPDFEVLFWVGCAGAFDPRAQKVSRAIVHLLNAANVRFAVLGESETCTGDSARRAGNEYLFQEIAKANVALLNAVKPPRILVTCPHCYHTLANEYPQFGGEYSVVHHTTYLEELLHAGRLTMRSAAPNHVTYHDPCYLGRHNAFYDAPRLVLDAAGAAITEMPRSRNNALCCGAGGAQFWKEEEPGNARVSAVRFAEACATQADTLAVSCPFCLRMLSDARPESGPDCTMSIKDIAEIVAEGIDGAAQ